MAGWGGGGGGRGGRECPYVEPPFSKGRGVLTGSQFLEGVDGKEMGNLFQGRFPSTQKSNYYERDWSKFKQQNFILDYFDKDWADLLQIDQQNVNLSLNSFLNNINSILDV